MSRFLQLLIPIRNQSEAWASCYSEASRSALVRLLPWKPCLQCDTCDQCFWSLENMIRLANNVLLCEFSVTVWQDQDLTGYCGRHNARLLTQRLVDWKEGSLETEVFLMDTEESPYPLTCIEWLWILQSISPQATQSTWWQSMWQEKKNMFQTSFATRSPQILTQALLPVSRCAETREFVPVTHMPELEPSVFQPESTKSTTNSIHIEVVSDDEEPPTKIVPTKMSKRKPPKERPQEQKAMRKLTSVKTTQPERAPLEVSQPIAKKEHNDLISSILKQAVKPKKTRR